MKNILIVTFLILQITFFLFLAVRSRSKYLFMNEISVSFIIDKRYIAPWMLLLDLIKHNFGSDYEKKLYQKVLYLTNSSNASFILRAYIAQELFLIYITTFIFLFISIFALIDSTLIFLFVMSLTLVIYLPDKKLDELKITRKRGMQIEFFDYLNKLILLIGAGINITSAIYRAANTQNPRKYFYKEISKTINEINNGKTFINSFECLAVRCGVIEITSFTSTLIQNIKKGNSELLPILRLQCTSCKESRKNMARKLAEEASTKLLIPTTLMFVAILIMIIFPALMQFKI